MGINPKNVIKILADRFCNFVTDTRINTDEKSLSNHLIEIMENAVYNEVEFYDDLQIEQDGDGSDGSEISYFLFLKN